MPKRMLRDWTDSETVNALSVHAERLFVRLIMKADDYGRFHAHPKLLRSFLFPILVDTIRDTDCSRWLAECEKAGLIRCYQDAAGKPLLEIVNFGQRMRESRPKFPAPADDCGDSPQLAATSGDFRPESGKEKELEARSEKRELEPAKPPKAASVYSSEFESWWEIYPQKKSKADAFKAWPKAVAIVMQVQDVAQPIAVEWLIEVAKSYRDSDDGRGQFVPNAATWLNGKRWEDDPDSWSRRNGSAKFIDPSGNIAALAEHRRRKAALFGEDHEATPSG